MNHYVRLVGRALAVVTAIVGWFVVVPFAGAEPA
jgi:hypothetical protein